MAKAIPKQLLSEIEHAIGGYPEGATLEIIQGLFPSVTRRSLQRHLASLAADGRIRATGKTRGARYHAIWLQLEPFSQMSLVVRERTSDDDDETEAEQDLPDEYISISEEGETLRQRLGALKTGREQAPYDRELLQSYVPNQTYYLTEAQRRHLSRIGRVPGEERPAGTYARKIFDRLLIDLSWNSSRLEGSTYTLLETSRLLELGERAEGKGIRDAQMILNHKAAIEFLVEQADEIDFNRYTIFNLHAMLADNLLPVPAAGGRLRSIPVGITGTVYRPPNVPQQLEEFFQLFLDKVAQIENPFEQALFTTVHIPYLQPFEDVNKRVSRLSANIPLIRGNFCPLSFVGVPERAYIDGILSLYEFGRVQLLRDVFVWAYDRSCERYSEISQHLGEPDLFRYRYRAIIHDTVYDVITGKLNKKLADMYVRQVASDRVDVEDRPRFIETTETEILSLHEGNFARYRVRPSEFQAWQEGWR